MTDEEKKAIEHLTKKMEYHKERVLDTFVWLTLDEHYVRVLLNLVEKQDNRIKELEADNYECNNIIRDYVEDWKLKTKIIDLMAEHLTTPIHSKKDVVEYFENLAKESGEIDE